MALILKIAAVAVALYFAIALGLVFSQTSPQAPSPRSGSVDLSSAVLADYSSMPPLRKYAARDGARLGYRRYDGGTKRLIVLVHGSAWHGMQFHRMASELAGRGAGTVVVPDLRGHGPDPVRRGDVDHIGQLEDDVADLIGAMTGEGEFGEVVLGGHSSGGGLVIRFAGGTHGAMADAFILMAPFLKYNAPTTRPNSGGWAYPATRRIVGLTMLNTVGVTALNHLPVLAFAMPAAVLDGPFGATATTRYSFRLNTSFAPRSDYESDLAAMTQPFLLIAGEADEAFHADRYEAVISAQTPAGTYLVLPGIDHVGATTEQAAIDAIAEWITAR